MKSFKNQIALLAAVTIVLFNFSSCKKYEDGPGLSLRTKTNRLEGNWEVVKINGQRLNQLGEVINLNFKKNRDFRLLGSFYSADGQLNSSAEFGDWDWENGREEIEIITTGFREDWEVLRLTNRELWFEAEDGSLWECEKNR